MLESPSPENTIEQQEELAFNLEQGSQEELPSRKEILGPYHPQQRPPGPPAYQPHPGQQGKPGSPPYFPPKGKPGSAPYRHQPGSAPRTVPYQPQQIKSNKPPNGFIPGPPKGK